MVHTECRKVFRRQSRWNIVILCIYEKEQQKLFWLLPSQCLCSCVSSISLHIYIHTWTTYICGNILLQKSSRITIAQLYIFMKRTCPCDQQPDCKINYQNITLWPNYIHLLPAIIPSTFQRIILQLTSNSMHLFCCFSFLFWFLLWTMHLLRPLHFCMNIPQFFLAIITMMNIWFVYGLWLFCTTLFWTFM